MAPQFHTAAYLWQLPGFGVDCCPAVPVPSVILAFVVDRLHAQQTTSQLSVVYIAMLHSPGRQCCYSAAGMHTYANLEQAEQ